MISSLILCFFVIGFIGIAFSWFTPESGDRSSISNSTYQRVAIDPALSQETAWHQDNNTGADAWIGNASQLTTGMKYYFQKTGVRPFLLINTIQQSLTVLNMTAEQRNTYVQEQYEILFEDDAHALFIISDDGNGNYRYDDYIGAQAKTAVDAEAVNILYDYFDKYWKTNLSEENLFSNSFRDAADRMMTVTKEPVSPGVILIIVSGILIALYFVLKYRKQAKENKLKEMELAKEILETPIDEI